MAGDILIVMANLDKVLFAPLFACEYVDGAPYIHRKLIHRKIDSQKFQFTELSLHRNII